MCDFPGFPFFPLFHLIRIFFLSSPSITICYRCYDPHTLRGSNVFCMPIFYDNILNKEQYGTNPGLFKQLQTVNTVSDRHYSCRLSKRLQTVKITAESCKPLQTCLLLTDAGHLPKGWHQDRALPFRQ